MRRCYSPTSSQTRCGHLVADGRTDCGRHATGSTVTAITTRGIDWSVGAIAVTDPMADPAPTPTSGVYSDAVTALDGIPARPGGDVFAVARLRDALAVARPHEIQAAVPAAARALGMPSNRLLGRLLADAA